MALDSASILRALVPFALLGAVLPGHPFDVLYTCGFRYLVHWSSEPRRCFSAQRRLVVREQRLRSTVPVGDRSFRASLQYCTASKSRGRPKEEADYKSTSHCLNLCAFAALREILHRYWISRALAIQAP